MTVLMILLGAGLGAPARYLTDRMMQSRFDTALPLGTLTVNIVASLILGVLAGLGTRTSPALAALVGTGFCGAMSTYSAFTFETLRLVQDGDRLYVMANIAVSLVAGIGAAAVGWWVGVSLT